MEVQWRSKHGKQPWGEWYPPDQPSETSLGPAAAEALSMHTMGIERVAFKSINGSVYEYRRTDGKPPGSSTPEGF